MINHIIQLKNVDYSYGRKTKVLKDVSLSVPKGSIYGFLGPNGAGKSTTMQLLAGQLHQQTGEIKLFENDLEAQLPYVFAKMGTLVESPALYMHLTGRENLNCIATLREIDKSKIQPILELVGLGDKGDMKVKRYSLGMKQRLAIGMALLGDPELLLLDEPVNGLDPTGITEVRRLLVELNQKHGITIFISSHLLSEIEKMCTHIGVIHRGEIKFEGTMQELQEKSSGHRVVLTTDDAKMHLNRLTENYPSAQVIAKNQIRLNLAKKSDSAGLVKFAVESGIPVFELRLDDQLENEFLNLTI
jgi:ABC-2 type transport system ATP-binding protein